MRKSTLMKGRSKGSHSPERLGTKRQVVLCRERAALEGAAAVRAWHVPVSPGTPVGSRRAELQQCLPSLLLLPTHQMGNLLVKFSVLIIQLKYGLMLFIWGQVYQRILRVLSAGKFGSLFLRSFLVQVLKFYSGLLLYLFFGSSVIPILFLPYICSLQYFLSECLFYYNSFNCPSFSISLNVFSVKSIFI